MKALKRILFIIILVMLFVLGYLAYYIKGTFQLFEQMHIDAVNDANSKVEQLKNKVVTIKLNDKSIVVKYGDLVAIDYNIEYPELKRCRNEVYKIDILTSVRTSKLYDEIESLYEEPVNAKLINSYDVGWQLIPEQDDYNFDVDIVYQDLDNKLSLGLTTYDLSSYVKRAEVVKEDLQEEYNKLSWINDFNISYESNVLIDKNNLSSYMNGSEVDIDKIDFRPIRKKLESWYDTLFTDYTFTTSNGDIITMPYTTYGKYIKWDDEFVKIKNAIQTHIGYNEINPRIYGWDYDIANEYIEVSIEQQHVWHYINGSLCCESDCVTGTKGTHDTPIGIYFISEMVPGKYLVGDNNEYKTWVDRWMRITNSGVGLHDAGWRGKFGGSIYTYNGSHGCINLPSKYAYNLYGEIENGTAVIVY